MRLALRWQVLGGPGLALLLVIGALGWEQWRTEAILSRIETVTDLREQLEREILRFRERHDRTIRRVREALLETRPQNRDAMLAWSADHYQEEMGRLAAEARRRVAAISVTAADAHLELDLARLDRQLERVEQQVEALVPALEELLAASASGDPDALSSAMQELDRRDREMGTLVRTASAMVRRAGNWQARQIRNSTAHLPPATWPALALFAALGFGLGVFRLERTSRLLTRSQAPSPSSPEERAIAERLERHRTELQSATQRQQTATRELERQSQNGRRLEQDLALLRLYNENLVNSLRAAVVVVDGAGLVVSFNRAARDLLGIDDDAVGTEAQTLPLYDALRSQRPEVGAELRDALANRTELRFEGVALGTGDRARLLDIATVPYFDESGAARGLLWVIDDVTEAVRTKSQLLAAERLAAVGRLSAQVAHEIRNPLSAIALNTELLAEELEVLPEGERSREARELLAAVAAEIERLTEVTEGYLHLARLPRPSFQQVDLNQIVSDLMAMLREELRAHAVDVTLELASPAPLAWADPGQLRQALLNIVRNSREALPEGGRITVRTSSHAGLSEVDVEDSGPGIPSEVLGRIFEPFYSTKTAGTGLGLSVTQQILREHDGQVIAEPSADGGARLRISLPASHSAVSDD